MTLEPIGQLCEVEITYKNPVKSTERIKVTSSSQSADLLRTLYNEDIIEHHEEFIVMFLNRANQVLGYAKTSQGGVCGTVVDVRIILQYAIKTNCSSIILSHNHPSGGLIPSEQDKTITRKIKEAARLMDISLLDHIILTTESYYSFADEGMI